MNEMKNKLLTYYEVQLMLPDYAFNRLSEEDKIIFEKSIISYPDLQKELEDVRRVFHKVEQTDFDGKFARKTRNLSVEVINKYQMKKSVSGFQSLTKYLVPTLGIFIVILLIWKGGFLFQSKTLTDNANPDNIPTKKLVNFSHSELSVVLDTMISEDDFILASGNMATSLGNDLSKSSLIETENLEEALNELYSEEVLGKILYLFGTDMIKSEIDFFQILSEIDNIELNDLQLILEELENVKIPS